MSALIARVRERKLFQWAVAYLAGAWLTLQLLDVLSGQLEWPRVVFRVALALLAAGFLGTLVLAWYHGEKGRQRVTGAELVMIGGILVIAAVGIALVRGGVGRASAAVARSGPAASTPAGADDSQPSIAVLPFADLSPGKDQEYFSDGITEEILNALAQLPALRVPGRTTSFSFKGRDVPISEIARELQVAHVLEGSVRKDGDHLRITAQLIDARTDRHLWSQTFDRSLTDVFAVQEEIARAVTEAIQLRIAMVPALGSRPPTTNRAAHDLYLLGLYEWNRRETAQALRHFEAAAAADTMYAQAYAGIALARVLPGGEADDPRETHALAERAARRAIALDSTLAEPHAALGHLREVDDQDLEAAEEEERKAIALNAAYPTAHQWYSSTLAALGRMDEALAEAERAVALDPQAISPRVSRGRLYRIVGRYDDAEADYRFVSSVAPDRGAVTSEWVRFYLVTERVDSAVVALQHWAAVGGFGPATLTKEEIDALVRPNTDPTRRAAIARRVAARAPEVGFDCDIIAALVSEPALALDVLEKESSARLCRAWRPLFAVEPLLAPLRSQPRFQALLRKAGGG